MILTEQHILFTKTDGYEYKDGDSIPVSTEPEFYTINPQEEIVDFLKSIFNNSWDETFHYFNLLHLELKKPFWALVLLEEELELAGHIVANREDHINITFAQYSDMPTPKPDNFIPKVGVICIDDKDCIYKTNPKSYLFNLIRDKLEDLHQNGHYILCLYTNEINKDWLNTQETLSGKYWNSYISDRSTI